VIGWFNPAFLSDYATTVGYTVYAPRKWLAEPFEMAHLLAHEWIHMERLAKLGWLPYSLSYLWPQCLALLALLAFLAIPFSADWLFALVALAALAPWPSVTRCADEAIAYAIKHKIVSL
jgi:hypothetical protein